MVLQVFREQVLCSVSKPLLSLTDFQLDSSVGAVQTQTQAFSKTNTLHFRSGLRNLKGITIFAFLVYNIKYSYGSVSLEMF